MLLMCSFDLASVKALLWLLADKHSTNIFICRFHLLGIYFSPLSPLPSSHSHLHMFYVVAFG